MSLTTNEIWWAFGLASGVLTVFGFLLVLSLVSNQRKVLRAQKEKLEKAARLEKVLQEMPRHILVAQESERKRIAGDLHDSVLQALTGTRLKLDTLNLKLREKSVNSEKELQEISDAIKDSISEIRGIVEGLRPKLLDDYGLEPALKHLCREVERKSGINIVIYSDELPQLSPDFEVGLYRIIQEALNNIEKHALASRARIDLKRIAEGFQVVVADNGRGFGLKSVAPQSMGLNIMRERVRILGGTVEVQSQPGQGTSVTIRIPSHLNEAADR